MGKSIWSILRTGGLWTMILAVTSLIALCFSTGASIWGWFFSAIVLVVVLFEVYYYLTRKKTISTKYKEYIIKHPVFGYLGLGLFALSMFGLLLHLALW